MTKFRKAIISIPLLSVLALIVAFCYPAAASAESELSAPSYSVSTYNVAAKYTWYAGSGADALAMYSSYHPDLAPSIYNTTVFEQVAFPATGSKDCVPKYILGASYNTATKTYSEKTSTEWQQDVGPNQIKVRYGVDARYAVVGQINHAMLTGTMPTEYDQPQFIWNNTAKNFQTIKGTISYHGYVSDIEVSVPWIGYKSTSVTLDGITFYLRTGPFKCSIKASSAVDVFDVKFGFGIA